ncbi:MAG: 1-deoxy-D-xylulose-5-phosphate reductoisomerase [Culicoidibacterales bacterium]
MKYISLIGASGSIGQQTIDVIANHTTEFTLVAVAVGRNLEFVHQLLQTMTPELICVQDEQAAVLLAQTYPQLRFVSGETGLIEVSTYAKADVLVNAVVGSVGLEPTLAAIAAKKTIALANKETLVTAGHLVMQAAREHGVAILPVDSEHAAIYQCLQGEQTKNIHKLILTASGGSFRDRTRAELEGVSVAEALNHPNWSMGAKITIDSATMMNKGLEVIEAHWLFDIDYDDIEVLMHRESIIHSMVEFCDTSVMAQLGTPDMRMPIQYALTYPDRAPLHGAKRLSLADAGQLHFAKADFERYPCLALAYEAGRAKGTLPTVMNAANEAAVALFLADEITFLDIERLIAQAMQEHRNQPHPDLATIRAVDQVTRERVQVLAKKLKN